MRSFLFLFRLLLLWSATTLSLLTIGATATSVSSSAAPPPVSVLPVQLYGVNYNTRQGPDWDANRCKSYKQVRLELSLLRAYTSRIRLLSVTDCNQADVVLRAASELYFKVLLGLWTNSDPAVFARELAALKQLQLDPNMITAITVGSESMYRNETSATQAIANMNLVRQYLQSNYSTIPVGIADVAPTYNAQPTLQNAVDVVVANAFPFWERVPVNTAVAHLLEQFTPLLLSGMINHKQVIVGETGWPAHGYNPTGGVASPDNQVQYFVDFYCHVDQVLHVPYYWLTGIDDAWRVQQDGTSDSVEGSFGFYDTNLTLKAWFQDLVFTCPGSTQVYTFAAANSAAPVALSSMISLQSAPLEAAPLTKAAISLSALAANKTTPSRAPVANSTLVANVTKPSPATNQTPSRAPATTQDASCAAHAACSGLAGDCCPTVNGNFLLCCGISKAPTRTRIDTNGSILAPNPVVLASIQPTLIGPASKTPTMRNSTNGTANLPTMRPTTGGNNGTAHRPTNNSTTTGTANVPSMRPTTSGNNGTAHSNSTTKSNSTTTGQNGTANLPSMRPTTHMNGTAHRPSMRPTTGSKNGTVHSPNRQPHSPVMQNASSQSPSMISSNGNAQTIMPGNTTNNHTNHSLAPTRAQSTLVHWPTPRPSDRKPSKKTAGANTYFCWMPLVYLLFGACWFLL